MEPSPRPSRVLPDDRNEVPLPIRHQADSFPRVRGRRFHRIQPQPATHSHRTRARWRFLSAQVDNETTIVPRQPRQARQRQDSSCPSKSHPHQPQTGYDIDGDGGVDVRELKLAKYLDDIFAKRRQEGKEELSAADTESLRQRAGRYMLAIEFVERNQGALGRYGDAFAQLDASGSVEFIANHKNFKKLMLHLEALERKKVMRSSQNMRNCLLQPDQLKEHEACHGRRVVAWHDASQLASGKAFLPSTNSSNLMEIQPLELEGFLSTTPNSRSPRTNVDHESSNQIVANAYGAVDINGDGIIDFDEMKLNLQVQELTLERENSLVAQSPSVHAEGEQLLQSVEPSAANATSQDKEIAAAQAHQERLRRQQMEGRLLMAKEFVQRNVGYMGIYNTVFQGKSEQEMIDLIATNECFARDYNRLRAQERVKTLKSSKGVASCLVQLNNDLQQPQPPSSACKRMIWGHRLGPNSPSGPTAAPTVQPSTKSNEIVPKLFLTPIRLQPVDSFAISNWHSARGHHAGI